MPHMVNLLMKILLLLKSLMIFPGIKFLWELRLWGQVSGVWIFATKKLCDLL
jgi:hypothetical protein